MPRRPLMKIRIVKKSQKSNPVCPWMIDYPPETQR